MRPRKKRGEEGKFWPRCEARSCLEIGRAVQAQSITRHTSWTVRAVWGAVIFLALIGMAATVRRAIVLFHSPQISAARFAPVATLDEGFARHFVLTFVHIVPGFLFMALAPFQFVRGLRNRRPRLHRWSGRIVIASGLVIGISALVMSYRMAIGGPNETAATTLFALLFLFSLTKALVHIRRREIAMHREWMIRAFGIGLGIATTRPIVGMFFAMQRLSPREFFGIAFWLGFTVTLIAAEASIHYTQPSRRGSLPAGSVASPDA
jgi:uncharacterized membrane protein